MGKRYWKRNWAQGWYLVDAKGRYIEGPLATITKAQMIRDIKYPKKKLTVSYEKGVEEYYE